MSDVIITIPARRAGKSLATQQFIKDAQDCGLTVRYADPRRKGPVQTRKVLTPGRVRKAIRDEIRRVERGESDMPVEHTVTYMARDGKLSARGQAYVAAWVLERMMRANGYRCGMNDLPEEVRLAAIRPWGKDGRS